MQYSLQCVEDYYIIYIQSKAFKLQGHYELYHGQKLSLTKLLRLFTERILKVGFGAVRSYCYSINVIFHCSIYNGPGHACASDYDIYNLSLSET